jgi:XisI protein
MASSDTYRSIIETIFLAYTRIPYAYGELQTEVIFDHDNDRYMLITVGWDNGMRVHICLAHIDICDGKVWIQVDNTEDGIANELVQAGIPKTQIVLGFRPPEVRKYTEYAAA